MPLAQERSDQWAWISGEPSWAAGLGSNRLHTEHQPPGRPAWQQYRGIYRPRLTPGLDTPCRRSSISMYCTESRLGFIWLEPAGQWVKLSMTSHHRLVMEKSSMLVCTHRSEMTLRFGIWSRAPATPCLSPWCWNNQTPPLSAASHQSDGIFLPVSRSARPHVGGAPLYTRTLPSFTFKQAWC